MKVLPTVVLVWLVHTSVQILLDSVSHVCFCAAGASLATTAKTRMFFYAKDEGVVVILIG